MAWSSYAHLPNREDEYWKILSNLKNGMPVTEVDGLIANVKGKAKVQHHYRSNLANIGLFDIIDGKIFLNYNPVKILKSKSYLKKILLECVLNCKNIEFCIVKSIIQKEETYNLEKIIGCITPQYSNYEKSSLTRWIRPIVNLFKIVDFLEIGKNYESEKILQESYLRLAKNFGKIIALEEVDAELKKAGDSYKIVDCLEKLVTDEKMKFKIELLMMPAWATHNEVYKINEDYYTHLRIKDSLV